MLIEIVKWGKYNPRSDAKAWSWFRFQASFFEDEDLEELPGPHLLVFIYLCCKRVKAHEPKFEIKLRHCAKKARTTEKDVEAALAALKGLGLISYDVPARTDPNVDERERTDPFPTDVRTYGRTDVTNDTLRTDESSPPRQLAEIWNRLKSPDQPKVVLSTFKSGTPRWDAAKARLAAIPHLEYWETVVQRIAASWFCNGKNDRAWVADFEFLTRIETHVKVTEGKYDNREAKPQRPRSAAWDIPEGRSDPNAPAIIPVAEIDRRAK